jgi:hypothetical protein
MQSCSVCRQLLATTPLNRAALHSFKEHYVRSRGGQSAEVEGNLFMAFWVLLSPQHAKQLGPVVLNK